MGSIIFACAVLLILYVAIRRGRNGRMCMATLHFGVALLAIETAVEMALTTPGPVRITAFVGLLGLMALTNSVVIHRKQSAEIKVDE